MLKRLKVLMLLQMSERFDMSKVTNKGKLLLTTLIKIVSMFIATALYTVILYVLCDIMMIPKNRNLLVFIVFVSQILGIISSAGTLMKSLYTSRENMILLSYPAKHHEVFISKILVFYIYEFIRNLTFSLPLLLSFGITLRIISANFFIALAVMSIVLPLIPVLFGALITIPVVFIKRLLSKYSLVKLISVIVLMVALYVLIVNLVSSLPVPLRLIAIYNSFMIKVVSIIDTTCEMSLFYRNIGDLLCGNNILVNYLVIFGVILLLLALVVIISMPLYFFLASKSSEESNIKAHESNNDAHPSLLRAFIKKEWLMLVRNPSEFISNYIFMFATPYVLFIMVTIFSIIDKNALGEKMFLAFTGFIALIMSSASNTASAIAITKEGSEFVLLKTSPGKTSDMALAKILFNVVISTSLLFISFLLVSILCPHITDVLGLWLVFICVVLVNFGLILWSFQNDIINPSLREYAYTGSSENIKNFSKSISLGLICSIIFTGLLLVSLIDDDFPVLSWGKILLFSVCFCGVKVYMFRKYLNAYFKDIEF